MSDTVARVTPAQRWTLPRGEIVVRARQADPRRDVEAAVFVHGLGGSTLNWVSLVAELDDDLDWVSVDLPGFGGSPPPRDGDYSPRGHARAVIGVIEEVQRRRGLRAPIHLVGNSLGGAVALQVTAARPDLVAGLTLVSPALPNLTLGRGNAHLPVVALPGVGESLVGRYARVPAAQRVAATLEACTVDDQRVPEDIRQALIQETESRDLLPYAHDAFLSSLRGLLATYADRGSRRPWRLARQVRQPVLAIYGEDDVLVDARGAARAAREFPDAEVVLLDDCGHVAQMEHPALVADLWLDRFARLSSAI